jgi:hypothetical protein
MNTISNSGRDGVSNVFAAALWTLDGSFEVAATGAVGVNLHQVCCAVVLANHVRVLGVCLMGDMRAVTWLDPGTRQVLLAWVEIGGSKAKPL